MVRPGPNFKQFSLVLNSISGYFSISFMNMPQLIPIQLRISLVADHDIWELLLNLKTIDGVAMENSTGRISFVRTRF